MTSEKSSLVRGETGPPRRYGAVKGGHNQTNSVESGENFGRRDCILSSCLFAAALACIGISLGLGLPALARKRATYFNLTTPVSESPLKFFKDYIVATDADYCAPIGANVLTDGGSAVDAAIATLFCSGAVHPHAMGIGGGAIFTIYHQTTRNATIIDGREVAPMGSEAFPKESLSVGNLSIAVPGELRAYEETHRLFGKLPWGRLVQPTIDLCNQGFPVTKHLADALAKNQHRISNDPNLRLVYFNKAMNRVYKEGERITCPQLAITLENIRDGTAATFYEGEVGKKLIADLARQGARLQADDLRNYKAEQRDALQKVLPLAGVTIYSPPPPGNGAILSLILSILDGYGYSPVNAQDVSSASNMYHQIAESFKFGYAAKTHLGDENFLENRSIVDQIMSEKFADDIRASIDTVTHSAKYYHPLYYSSTEEHGTAHTTVLTSKGEAVAVTSSINGKFGSFILSPQTGILLNNHMADFSLNGPANGPNAVASKKRPMSSMAPAVFVDGRGVPRLIVGGAGGTRITTGEAQIALRHLYLDQDVKSAVDSPRLHHQLTPNKLIYQEDFPRVLLDNLMMQKGHKVTKELELSAICAVSMDPSGIYGNVDFRKGGSIAGQ